MRRALPLSLLIAAGCQPDPEPGPHWIAPMDGQTRVSESAALVVHVGGLQLPSDYPLPEDFIRVVDLGTGGFVPGALSISDEEIRFEPRNGWEPGARYAWSVGDIEALDRAPELGIPGPLYGEAVFDTGPALEVLELALDQDQLCAVLSHVVDDVDPAGIVLTIDDEPVPVSTVHLHGEQDFVSASVEEGVSVACFPGPTDLIGRTVRIWWGQSGPFGAQISERPVHEALLLRRRAL